MPASLELGVVALTIEAGQDGHELTGMEDEAAHRVMAIDQDGNRLKGYGRPHRLPPLGGERSFGTWPDTQEFRTITHETLERSRSKKLFLLGTTPVLRADVAAV